MVTGFTSNKKKHIKKNSLKIDFAKGTVFFFVFFCFCFFLRGGGWILKLNTDRALGVGEA